MSDRALAARARDLAVHALRAAAAEAILDSDDATQCQHIADHLDTLAGVVEARPLDHVIQFQSDHAIVMHPLIGCGANLFDCPASFTSRADFGLPGTVGRFLLTIGVNGSLSAAESRPVGDLLTEIEVMVAARPKIRLHLHPSSRSVVVATVLHMGLAGEVELVDDPVLTYGLAYIECVDCPDVEPAGQPPAPDDRWYVMHEHMVDGATEVHSHPADAHHQGDWSNHRHDGVGVASWEDLRVQIVQDAG